MNRVTTKPGRVRSLAIVGWACLAAASTLHAQPLHTVQVCSDRWQGPCGTHSSPMPPTPGVELTAVVAESDGTCGPSPRASSVSGEVAATRPFEFTGNWSASLCAHSGSQVAGDGRVSYSITGSYITFTRTDQTAAPGETVQVRLNMEYWMSGTALVGQPKPPQGNGAWLGFWFESYLETTGYVATLVAGQSTDDHPTNFNIDTGWVSWETPLRTVPLNIPEQLDISAAMFCDVNYDLCASCPPGTMTAAGTMRCRLSPQPFTFVGPGTYTANAPPLLIVNNVWPMRDCNQDGIYDDLQLAGNDCNSNLVHDGCEPDCNGNETADSCDLMGGAADCNSNGTPDACELDGPGTISQIAKLIAPDAAAGDALGTSVAIDGDLAVVGAPLISAQDTGAAYVYRRTGNDWNFETKLTVADSNTSQQLGTSVAVSGDTVLLGARGDDDLAVGSGAVYVFRHNGAAWVQEAKLKAADAEANAEFGASVSVDGDRAVIGAVLDDHLVADTGAAYVFRRVGTVWSQDVRLLPPVALPSLARYGHSVSISGDAVLVGAQRQDRSGLTAAGAAYGFRFDGMQWISEGELDIQNPIEAFDRIGGSVCVNGDMALVSADGDDDVANGGGAVYVFEHTGSAWLRTAKLMAADVNDVSQLGQSVAIVGDTALIGAWRIGAAGFESGMAYVFQFAGSRWTQVARLLPPDVAANDRFSNSLALSAGAAIIGMARDDDAAVDAGAAYLFAPADHDCNNNSTPDECDIAAGTPDGNGNGVPDGCENGSCPTCPGDMNGDLQIDATDIQDFTICAIDGGACECANVDGISGVASGDVQIFVEALLIGANCP